MDYNIEAFGNNTESEIISINVNPVLHKDASSQLTDMEIEGLEKLYRYL